MQLTAFPFLLLRAPINSLRSSYQVPDLGSPIFGEGLCLASPAFWRELQKKDRLRGAECAKIERTLSKYWIRSCMRSTPFGTFAGSTLAFLTDSETCIELAKGTKPTARFRIDMKYLTEMVAAISSDPGIRSQLLFFPNSTLYYVPGSFRYAGYTVDRASRNYQLMSIDEQSYLKSVFKQAKAGATIGQLSNMLECQEDVSWDEAENFILELIASQLLLSELEPCLTGNSPLTTLIGQLKTLEGAGEIVEALEEVRLLLERPQNGPMYVQALEESLQHPAIKIEGPENALQADLFLATNHGQINEELMTTVMQQVDDLLAFPGQHGKPELDEFKARFSARYEDEEIPLAIALDADLGVGYGHVHDAATGGGDLLDELAIYFPGGRKEERTTGAMERFVLSKYEAFFNAGADTLVITGDDLRSFKQSPRQSMPNSMYLMGSLLKREGLLDKDHFCFYVAGLGGPSAANLFARFASGDEQLCRFTKEILRREEAEFPDALFAEVVHLPQPRVGNILQRPLLRAYEIPYLGKSGADPQNQILIDDLLVSIRNDEVHLRSKRLNKRVLPRLTTAHNFHQGSIPIYKFLCDLQGQGSVYPTAWSWGALNALKHLPRVTYKNLILQRAKWTIESRDIEGLSDNPSEYLAFFDAFRMQRGLPALLIYSEGDNELLLDLSTERGIDLLLHYLKRFKAIRLEEFLFSDENCVVRDEGGNPFTHDLIIPMFREAAPRAEPLPAPANCDAKRKFSPGSEWQYFKVYCGSKTAERVLCDTILPFVEKGIKEALFQRFFFIRYNDDWNHLRIRFYNSDLSKGALLHAAFVAVLQPLMASGLVDKLQVDTYNRELERYGPETIEEAEELFYNDSLAVLKFISLLDDAESGKYRILFALRGIDMLLDDFGLNLAGKQDLLRSLQVNYFREFGGDARLQKQLNEKYRRYRDEIFSHLESAYDEQNDIVEAVDPFRMRSEMNRPVVRSITAKLGGNDQTLSLSALLPSYIHMFMNRLFIARQKKYELIVYHFLEKYYSSRQSMIVGKADPNASKKRARLM